MLKINVVYEGNLRCRAEHTPTGIELQTDAPVDNEGLGATFSPTDLVATALASCMATIMGIHAKRHDLSLDGMELTVEKHMSTEPRRIASLPVVIEMPAGIAEKYRQSLQAAAHLCPVHASLHPDIEVSVDFRYP